MLIKYISDRGEIRMSKLLKKAIWDFHTKGLLGGNAEYQYLQGSVDICELLKGTVSLILSYSLVYSIMAGIPLYLISGWVLYFFVGMGEMLYVDITVEFLIAVCVLVVAAGVGYLMAKLLMFTCQGLAYLYPKVRLPKFDLRSKICFKVDFKDMEE